jgi:hypothetical protein
MGRLNKPAKPDYKYRSPGQTNAKDATPNLREDVFASQKADSERIAKGMDTAATRPQNRKQVQEAGGRAITRAAGRAALLKGAFDTGYGIGEEVEKRTGAGKKLVEKSGLGDLAAKVGEKIEARKPRVKLSQEAQDRVDDEGVDKILRNFKDPDTSQPGSEYKRGGKVSSASSRADGIATKGKTRGRFL